MTEPASHQIRFRSYNPYESKYPGLRVVSRETLHLIKTLRAEGFSVVVEPDDGTKLNYLMEKGLREFLSDPIIALVVSTSLPYLINFISNFLRDRFKRQPTDDEVNMVIIEIDEKGTKARYNFKGEQMSDKKFQSLVDSLDKRSQGYRESLRTASPNPARPLPIFLEHTTKIVGWGCEGLDSDGAFRVKTQITNDETWERKQSGELKGFSPGGIVYRSTCSVCNGDYVDCNHIAGREYDGVKCTVQLNDFAIVEISIVKDPVQPLAKFDDAKERE